MSNAIDLIVQDKAIKGLDGLIVKLQKAHEEIQKINAKGIDFTKTGSPTGLKQVITLTDEYNKLVKQTEKALIQEQLAQTETNKSLLEARARKNAVNKETRLQIKYEQALEGVYSKMDAKLSMLNKEYRDLAVRKEIGVKLTIEEEKRMDFLIKKITKYDGVLKKVDAQAGKNQRNVGNYKSAFDGLGFSITQLAREAPAFANSMQTGFMAISNNLPMFFDEISKTKKEVANLRAEGVKTQGTLAKLAKSFFSLQVLLSVGVTLLTLYGADLVKWASSMFTASDATEKMKENTKKLNKESAEISSKTIPQFKALVKIAQDVTETEKRRADAIKELNKTYPDFNANILSEKNNTELVNSAISSYILKIGQKAKAQATMSMLQERYNKLIIEEQKLEKKQKNILDAVNSIRKANNKELFKTSEEAIKYVKSINDAVSGSGSPRSMRGGSSPMQSMYDGINKQLKTTSKIQEEINALMDVYIDNVDLEEKKTTKSSKKNVKNKLKVIESHLKERNEIEKLIKAYKMLQEPLMKGTIEYKTIQDRIDALNGTAKAQNLLLDETYNKKVRDAEADIKRRKELEALQKATEKHLESTAFSKLGEFGMGSLQTFFDGSFDKLLKGADTTQEKFAVTFNAIAEAGKEMFSLLNGFGQENFDAELDRISQNEAIRLQFANGNAEAEAEISRQAEEERKRVQKRQAEANKENALFNIAISTAQGVVSALAMTPPNPILAGIIGGIGAVQLAKVASTEIPQFKDGVRDFTGGMAVVGDGGVQEVIETKNGISLTPSTDTLVNLPKGANVYSSKEEFFNEKLNKVLINNGISPITRVKEQKQIDEVKLAKLIGREVKKIPKGNAVINFDQKGINSYWDNGIRKKKMLNSRVRGLGNRT